MHTHVIHTQMHRLYTHTHYSHTLLINCTDYKLYTHTLQTIYSHTIPTHYSYTQIDTDIHTHDNPNTRTIHTDTHPT